MYYCENCLTAKRLPETVAENGENIAPCKVCGAGNMQEVEVPQKNIERLSVLERLADTVVRLNCLRKEFSSAKALLENEIDEAEGELYELFCEIAGISDNLFLRKLEGSYFSALDKTSAEKLRKVVREAYDE